MRLLLCSFEFDAGAEGICTGRLVRALLDAGCHIHLVTSQTSVASFQHERLTRTLVFAPQLRPLLYSMLARLSPAPRADFLWCRRVARLRFPGLSPAMVYGRSMPISSVEAARLLALRWGWPLWTHFSDPFPNSWEEPGSARFARMARYAKRVVRGSQRVTFTTRQGLAFQEKSMNELLSGKAFVLQHISPAPAYLGPGSANPPLFTYIGSFYGKRNADVLLEGFALHLRAHPDSRFAFIGTDPLTVIPKARQLGIETSVKVHGRVADVRPHMRDASVLVALDAAQGDPVFLPTKIVEYLVVNRPVLILSPEKSPSSELANRFQTSTVRENPSDPAEVASSMAKVLRLTPRESDYAFRFQHMNEFGAAEVAECFMNEAKKAGVD